MSDAKQRHVFSLVDGISASEGHGPFQGTRRDVGILVAGDDSLANDIVCARLMGFDWRRIRTLAGAYPECLEVRAQSANADSTARLEELFLHDDPLLGFEPPAGWDGLRIAPRGQRTATSASAFD